MSKHNNHGWRIKDTNLADCEAACELIGCAEISMTSSGVQCFLSKSTCTGGSRTGDTKYKKKECATTTLSPPPPPPSPPPLCGVADQEKWVEATDPDNHWCDSHNVEDFSDADADRITHFGALGTLNLHSRGWRITGTNLDNCKMICALANCKEFSLNKNNDQCFIAKETCSGTSRKSDTKYVESPDVEAACPRNGGGCADVDAVKYGGPDGEKLNCCEICRMKKICSDSPECKSSFSARRLSDADLMQISARHPL